jgi:hypothetical protein
MSKSREQKQARKQARAQKQTAMAAANYQPTGKSKYATKQGRRNRPDSPFRVTEQEQEV